MRILFLTDNFPPEVNAPASRTFEHCREWVQAGHQVTVITCAPNFPQGKVYAGYKNKLYQEELVEGIRVIRVWSYITANEGFVKRILDYISFAMMAVFAGLFKRCDLIVATSPQFFTAVGGCMLAFLKRKPWVMEVRDLWPESIKAVGAMKAGRMYHMLERLELFLYRNARAVVVVTDAFKANLSNRGIREDKIHVIKNGVLLDQFSPRPKDAALLAELGLEGKFVLAYLGTHGMAHALEFVLRASAALPDDVRILLIGDGAEKARLLKIKEAEHFDKVLMLDSVTKSEIARYIAVSDVALVNLQKSDTFKTVIPSKIFENAAMQRPILLGVAGESKALIEQYDAGLCFEPENESDFLAKTMHLRVAGTYGKCQEGCTRLAQDFNRKTLAHRMLSILENI